MDRTQTNGTAPRDCLDEDAVLGFVDRSLDATALDLVELHLDSCAECRRLVSDTAKSLFPSDAQALAAGVRVSRYGIEGTLGRGGMGIVYRAFDPQLKRRVALKVIRTDRALGEGATERHVREAEAMARLSHPNVVAVFDAGTFEGAVFLVMELVEGQTLDEWLRTSPRDARRRIEVFIEAGRGLEAAHRAGIVHRDFKPGNVLLGDDGRVRVTDFGLAGPVSSPRGDNEPETPPLTGSRPWVATELTQTGTLLGTPAFMAPEQFAGMPADPRTDQFSFCVALYTALYEERPFEGETLDALALNVVAGHVRAPKQLDDVPAAAEAAVLRGLRLHPEQRFPSMAALVGALEAGVDAAPRAQSGVPEKRAPPRGIAVGIVLLVLAAASVFAVARPRTAPPAPAGSVVAEESPAPEASAPIPEVTAPAPAPPSSDEPAPAVRTLPRGLKPARAGATAAPELRNSDLREPSFARKKR